MIAYYPLEDLQPAKIEPEIIKPVIGHDETELNYVIMGFIVGVVVLAISDSIRA
jgi:hypothetical protein